MSRPFPVRRETHQLEEQSKRFFRNCLPRNWTCQEPSPDYGVDLRVDIFEGDAARGLELLVQLKASKASSEGTNGDTERIRLRTATYNLLRDKLQVAMLVKFVESKNEAYWLLFRDIPAPPQNNKTFSVRIPKANRLSSLDWSEIKDYVRSVTNKKLAANKKAKDRIRE